MENIQSHKRYGFFQAPVLAWFSKDLYADVYANWKGSGALYMFLLVSFAWMVNSVAMAMPVIQLSVNKDVALYLTQLPTMKFTNGKMSIDKPYPYEMKDPHSGQTVAVFIKNREGTTTRDTDPPVVITDSYVLCRGVDQPAMDFAQLPLSTDAEVTGPQIRQTLNILGVALPFIFFLLLIVPIFLAHVLQMLAYGGVATMIGKAMEMKLPYQTGMRLAAIAMSPAVVVSVLISLATMSGVLTTGPIQSPTAGGIPAAVVSLVWMVVSVPVVIGYLCLAANAAKDSQSEPAFPDP